jgi:putative OPT family oligopeptide transporter
MNERAASEQGESRAELSVRAIFLGALLSVILAAANAYLGLFAGMTVSASIPASVISMGILRAVGGTILENNQVQTAASAGESAAAGAIFTLPALVMLGHFSKFPFWLSAFLIGTGGLLGVLFTILLRRALVVPDTLPFPEGTATAAVLRAGHARGKGAGSEGLGLLVLGAFWGAVAKLMESGLALSKATVEGAFALGSRVFYFGSGVSPALGAVGYIVGLEVALVIFLGGAVNWLVFLPFSVPPEASGAPLEIAFRTWSERTRYLGVGAMTVGGILALVQVRHAIASALSAGWLALWGGASERPTPELRDRDLPSSLILCGIAAPLVPLCWVFYEQTGSLLLAALLTALVLIFGFLFSSVAAYMAGLVGSSNNPVSGVTIATILFTSLFLTAYRSLGGEGAVGPALAIVVGSIVCSAAAIGGDNVQDLRAGQLLGATPYRQQIMQLLGVLSAALVLGPVLQLLLDAYGFGAPTAAHPEALRAPQATLMASVSQGVFGGRLPWGYFGAGAALGLCALGLDAALRRKSSPFRFPVLAFALGLYLPWELSVPVLLGGIVKKATSSGSEEGSSRGVLAAAGLITGEALMGIILASVVAGAGSLKFLRIFGPVESVGLSLFVLMVTLLLLGSARTKKSA